MECYPLDSIGGYVSKLEVFSQFLPMIYEAEIQSGESFDIARYIYMKKTTSVGPTAELDMCEKTSSFDILSQLLKTTRFEFLLENADGEQTQ